jgi:sugar phosphate isomerase/epimerase
MGKKEPDMARKVTIFTGQWADLPLAKVCAKMREFGYDGLELACWGDHFDLLEAAKSKKYCDDKRALLAKHGLDCWAISAHLMGQLTCDPNNDSRSDGFCADKKAHGNAEKKRAWGVAQMMAAPAAAKNMGVTVVNGFMGSPIWHMLYAFPPVTEKDVDEGFAHVKRVWTPILAEFKKHGVRFALEVHPTEIAFDLWTAERLLAEFKGDKTLGFNFDPSHLLWQGVDPVKFLNRFRDRIYHVHMKDVGLNLDGETGILGSHLSFGDARRGWDFKSLGHGDVKFDPIVRALNAMDYRGPLSVEWEDSGMDREFGAQEACAFVKKVDFPPSAIAFDSNFDK